jgi:hypothetical protein
MSGIAISGGSLASLFLPMGYEGATSGSTIASKTALIVACALVTTAYYAALDSRLFGPVLVVWFCAWASAWIVVVALDLSIVPTSSMQLSVLVEMLAVGLGACHSAGVLLTGLAIGGRGHVKRYLLAFAPGVMAVCIYVAFPVIDLVLLAEDTLQTSLLRPAVFLATKRLAMALQYKTCDLVPCANMKLLGLVVVSVNVAMLNNRAVSGIASWSALGVFLAFDALSWIFRCWVHSDFLCSYAALPAEGSVASAAGAVGPAGAVCWTLQAELLPTGAPRPVRPHLLKRLVRVWPDSPAGTSESLISYLVLHFEGEIQSAVHLHYLLLMFPVMQIEAFGLTHHPLASYWFPREATTGMFLVVMFAVNAAQALFIRFMFRLRASDLAARTGLLKEWTSRKKLLSFAGACWNGAFIPACTNWVVYWALQQKAIVSVDHGNRGSNLTAMVNSTNGTNSTLSVSW